MLRIAIAPFFLMLLLMPAAAQKRVALVIGNSAYRHAPALANPKNDATDMAAALKRLGFVVIDGFDLDKVSLERKVRDFSTGLQGADTGLFYYAGHGLQVAGQNYLVPIDAKAETADAVDWEMVRLDLVQRTMERATATNIIFLDACRNNPLTRNLARAMGTRSTEIGRGLAPVESGVGTLISFSTQPGNVALDGVGQRNSPFAGSLVKHVSTSSDDLSAVLIAVRLDVMQQTQRKQVPWEHSALTGRFYFKTPTTTVMQPQSSEAERAWDRTKDTTSIATLEAFIGRYGDTYYGDLAKVRLAELKVAMVAKQVEPHVPPAGKVFRDCPDSCPEMVVVPAGSFMMGSPRGEAGRSSNEEPQRRVTIERPLAVGKFEVTFDEWDACVAAGGCKHRPSDSGWGKGRRPVINVSWNDAVDYATWLSRRTGKQYRLLSEAEWEYAARAGTTSPYAVGTELHQHQAQIIAKQTAEVGSFPANQFGLHDLHGNVWEWVEDAWHPNYQGGPVDGSAWKGGDTSLRVMRGGSWIYGPWDHRSAFRYKEQPGLRYDGLGFRVARAL